MAAAIVAIVPLAVRMASIPEKRAQVPAILIVGIAALILALTGVIGAAIAPRRRGTAVALLLISGVGGFLVFNPTVWLMPAGLQIIAAVAVWRDRDEHRQWQRGCDGKGEEVPSASSRVR